MATLQKAEVFRYELDWGDAPNGSDTVNVLYLQLTSTSTFLTQADADALRDAVTNNAWYSEDAGLQQVRLTRLDGTEEFISSATGQNGIGTKSLPANCALLATKRTPGVPPRQVGRCFFPGPLEGDYQYAGVLGQAQVTAREANLNAWLADVVAVPPIENMVHVIGGINPALPTVEAFPITGFTVEATLATQRRRLRT